MQALGRPEAPDSRSVTGNAVVWRAPARIRCELLRLFPEGSALVHQPGKHPVQRLLLLALPTDRGTAITKLRPIVRELGMIGAFDGQPRLSLIHILVATLG